MTGRPSQTTPGSAPRDDDRAISEAEPDITAYVVVVNGEGEHSVWPKHRDVPPGWSATGKMGQKAECLEAIDLAWRNRNPRDHRARSDALESTPRPDPEIVLTAPPELTESASLPSLLDHLSSGSHPVEAASRSGGITPTLNEAIDRGYVRIRFPGTRGGTTLGIRLDRTASVLVTADFENRTGNVHLEGDLILDRARARCVVDLDVSTGRGAGFLVPPRDQSVEIDQESVKDVENVIR